MTFSDSVEPDAAREARGLMEEFLGRTGVTREAKPRRYLWTDAFAVCNLLSLAEATGDSRYRDNALGLIGQVHRVLGRHRGDDGRTGWISGLGEDEGCAHPTAGGLRIGKPLPEREADEPADEVTEWNRDGQYFHYLTKWLHALDVTARATGDEASARACRELMQAAADHFIVDSRGGPRMVWKMSIDLSRPQVASMGQHDALDGHLRCLQLESGALAAGDGAAASHMQVLAERFHRMVRRDDLATPDPLGMGGLLTDATLLSQLIDGDRIVDDGLLDALLHAAEDSVLPYAQQNDLKLPAKYRLGFRELGLAIGLCGMPVIERQLDGGGARFQRPEALLRRVRRLSEASSLGRTITSFWLRPPSRDTQSWSEHRDINDVMLATALLPTRFIEF